VGGEKDPPGSFAQGERKTRLSCRGGKKLGQGKNVLGKKRKHSKFCVEKRTSGFGSQKLEAVKKAKPCWGESPEKPPVRNVFR